MRTPYEKLLGAFIMAMLIIIARGLGFLPEAHAQTVDQKVVWKEIQPGEWVSRARGVSKPIVLSYRKHTKGEVFTVTLPCTYVDRSYRVTWYRGDTMGIIPVTCAGAFDGAYPIDDLLRLFRDLPNGAAPAEPASFYSEPYDGKVFA